MADLDVTKWYLLVAANVKTGAFKCTALYDSNTRGAVGFSALADPIAAIHLWQLVPVPVEGDDSGRTYVLRCKEAGSGAYFAIGQPPSATDRAALTRFTDPIMEGYNIAWGKEIVWRLDPWGDGTFSLANTANGTGRHLLADPSRMLVDLKADTDKVDAARWSIVDSGVNVANPLYSTVALPSTTLTVTQTTPTSTATSSSVPITTTDALPPSYSESSSSSGGLGTGAIIGIVVSVSLVVLIAIGALFYFIRRRGGAANKNSSRAYVNSSQAYVNSSQAYVNPSQAYVNPSQAYVNSSQAYVKETLPGGHYPVHMSHPSPTTVQRHELPGTLETVVFHEMPAPSPHFPPPTDWKGDIKLG